MTTTYLTLSCHIYNSGGEDDDYEVFRNAALSGGVVPSADAMLIDTVLTPFMHYVNNDFDALDHCPLLSRSKLDTSAFTSFRWRHIDTRQVPEDETAVDVNAEVDFEIVVPLGMLPREVQSEFYAAFCDWSNNSVEWGWLDGGYVFDTPGRFVQEAPTSPGNEMYEEEVFIRKDDEGWFYDERLSFIATMQWYLNRSELLKVPVRKQMIFSLFRYIDNHALFVVSRENASRKRLFQTIIAKQNEFINHSALNPGEQLALTVYRDRLLSLNEVVN